MAHSLIGIHAALGEAGVFAFLWLFVEILNPTVQRIKRARIAAILGLVLFVTAWLAGGYYYLTVYGSEVKPLIKEGPNPEGHKIFMETKEHVFLFLPFLALFVIGTLYAYDVVSDDKAKLAILAISGLIILLGLAMAAMGYLISTSARIALEVGI